MFALSRRLSSCQSLKYPGSGRCRFILTSCAISLFLSFANVASAAFITPYALSDFTLTNNSACALDAPDGSVSSPNNGVTAILTGSNSGSGCSGFTDLTTTAKAAGLVQFHFDYSSPDSPGGDAAGYLLGTTFNQFADTSGQTGDLSFAVTLGQTFGFRITTVDNTGEPGILTISNFSAPGALGPVPEPGTLSLLFASGVGVLAIRGARGIVKGRRAA